MDNPEKQTAPSFQEVQMVDADIVRAIRDLHALGWGSKRISQELGIARNTVRRYLRGGPEAEIQVRPKARRLDQAARKLAAELYAGPADGNAAVVRDMLEARGIRISLRTVQRAVEGRRREVLAQQVATVRYETAPGAQMQVDFGQRFVRIAGQMVRVFLLVVVLGYSRRISVRAFLSERQDDWREGLVAAFRRFGGVTRDLLVDNARALVLERDNAANTVRFHPAFHQFCQDWNLTPKACRPYRAQTKGKVESGIKYLKRNAIAKREFASFAELEAHLAWWQDQADQRVHGTTHEVPMVRFLREEQAALRPLPRNPLPARQQRTSRIVAHDAFVAFATVRYSVPYQLVRERVELMVGEDEVRVYRGTELVARHRRSFEPYDVVTEPSHHAGLWRTSWDYKPPADVPSPLVALGRSLDDYAAVIAEVAG